MPPHFRLPCATDFLSRDYTSLQEFVGAATDEPEALASPYSLRLLLALLSSSFFDAFCSSVHLLPRSFLLVFSVSSFSLLLLFLWLAVLSIPLSLSLRSHSLALRFNHYCRVLLSPLPHSYALSFFFARICLRCLLLEQLSASSRKIGFHTRSSTGRLALERHRPSKPAPRSCMALLTRPWCWRCVFRLSTCSGVALRVP